MSQNKKEQMTIRLPAELKEKIQAEADKKKASKQITLRIQEDLFHELKIVSKQMGLTITALLIVAIWWNVLAPEYSQR